MRGLVRLAVTALGCIFMAMAATGPLRPEVITPAHAVSAVFLVGGFILLAMAALEL